MFSLQGDSSSSDRNFYGPGLQSRRLGWGEPYTPSRLSPGMPPSDPFTDSAPAPLQCNYQFHQGAYMHDNQQMTALHDRCKALEIQVIKLTTERDTLQANFQQLANALQQSGNPLTLDPTFSAQLGSNDTNHPTPQTHPKIHFWTQIDYIEWLDTSMGRLSDRGKLGYLEDENGGPIATTMVKGIRKALRAGWCELTNRKLAPKTWGVLSASGRKLIHTLMEDAYPLLKFADGGWKLEYLASTSYSAWHRTYLTDYRNWKSRNHGNEDDDDDESDNGNTGNSRSSNSNGKKRKKAKFSIKSEVPQKKMKVNSEPLDMILPQISTTNILSSSTPSTQTPDPSAPDSPHSLMGPTSPTPDAPTPDSPRPSPIALAPLTLASLTIGSLAPDSPPELLSTAPALLAPEAGLDLHDKENVPSKLIDAPTCINVVIANPLAALALAASKVQLPPLPLGPAPPPLPSAPNGANSESTTQNHASLPIADNVNVSKAATGSTKSGAKGKMCPSSTKNGRNLCAQRWLKTLKTNGTTKEFCSYYGDLTPAQRKAYDDESASLVANKSWNKTAYNGTIY
ncbi:uncharacterized protein F5891DRAFT_1183702 [Suillus fuscotomentosus]|uniref:Uncharacterized protein n=1 Tax=Suillus fuscotomentosus TaxID=1912939 RepID=A0AAD4EF03_9AGAM|nr:uncharacterized protein F5891DRAFT_1183702 [Suillus fuscotomentosus]KAG1905033.1 hypothetical protein F5891DRAFT_1183702 [Suillus fuscotomentosus]